MMGCFFLWAYKVWHFFMLKDTCNVWDQSTNFWRSCWSSKQSNFEFIYLYSTQSSAKSLIIDVLVGVIDVKEENKRAENCFLWHPGSDWYWTFELWTLNLLLQQHFLCGVSGWRGEGAGRLSQPADSWMLPQFFILWQLPEENSNQG